MRRPHPKGLLIVIYRGFGLIFLCVLCGCPVMQPQNVPQPTLRLYDDEFKRDYFVYLPSTFGIRPLPLVITCHGTPPWDSAERQINEWKHLAEKNNFVAVAPEIHSARGFIPPSAKEAERLLLEDEAFILKIIKRLVMRGNIDRSAIFITGWSSGGFITYFAGLRNNHIFKAIVARQSNFIREYYKDVLKNADRNQPILIFYGTADLPLLQADSQIAYEELTSCGMRNVKLLKVNSGHSRHPEIAWKFFKSIINFATDPKPKIAQYQYNEAKTKDVIHRADRPDNR